MSKKVEFGLVKLFINDSKEFITFDNRKEAVDYITSHSDILKVKLEHEIVRFLDSDLEKRVRQNYPFGPFKFVEKFIRN